MELFIQVFNRELGKQVRGATPETIRLLESHDWPGNVRELENTIKNAMIHAAGDLLTPDYLPENFPTSTLAAATSRFGSESAELEVAQLVECSSCPTRRNS